MEIKRVSTPIFFTITSITSPHNYFAQYTVIV